MQAGGVALADQVVAVLAVGVIIDAIAVRSLLVPALVALFGRLGMWPGARQAIAEAEPRPEAASAGDPAVRR